MNDHTFSPAQAVGDPLARNTRVKARYDELMAVGKHGHYETLFRIVREEVELASQPPAAPVETEERDRCISICEGWLERFAGMDIQYTSAREYACDVVNDIIDLIRDGVDPRSQAKEPEASGGDAQGATPAVRVGEASADLPTTSEIMDVTAGETAPHSSAGTEDGK